MEHETTINRETANIGNVLLCADKLKESLAFQRPQYCCKKIGNTGRCSQFATWKVKLCSRTEQLDTLHLKYEMSYRCDEHKQSGTVNRKVFETRAFDQSYAIDKVNKFLNSIIGKIVKCKVHTAKGLEVKYRKDNGGVMCFHPITKKWKFVYYDQITEVRGL
jgi:hypothetical protein